jgi:hypothetical protein
LACPADNDSKFPPFQWMQCGEDVVETWVAYMAHLADNVPLPPQYAFADMQQHRSSLSVDLSRKEKQRKFSGTSDIVVTEVRNIQNDASLQNTCWRCWNSRPLTI